MAATTESNSSAVNPGDVLGIMKMELGDFREALSGLEVKVERLGAAFDEKFSTAADSLVSYAYERLHSRPWSIELTKYINQRAIH